MSNIDIYITQRVNEARIKSIKQSVAAGLLTISLFAITALILTTS